MRLMFWQWQGMIKTLKCTPCRCIAQISDHRPLLKLPQRPHQLRLLQPKPLPPKGPWGSKDLWGSPWPEAHTYLHDHFLCAVFHFYPFLYFSALLLWINKIYVCQHYLRFLFVKMNPPKRVVQNRLPGSEAARWCIWLPGVSRCKWNNISLPLRTILCPLQFIFSLS